MTATNAAGREYRSPDWDRYRMDYHDPHRRLESKEQEIAECNRALEAMRAAAMIPHGTYDVRRFDAFRRFVAENFEIPWTAITPRMQRVIWAINAIHQPRRMVAAGCFCGNTFICNAGAAMGPGRVYPAEDLIGIEIDEPRALIARRNLASMTDASGLARIVTADAVAWASANTLPIDLLYLDADGTDDQGKSIYLTILQAAMPCLTPGALVLAHNSVNCADQLADYLCFVRDRKQMRGSINIVVDGEGLEVSRR